MKNLTHFQRILSENFLLLEQEYKVKKIGVFDYYTTSTKEPVNILVELWNPNGWEYEDLKDYLTDILDENIRILALTAFAPEWKTRVSNRTVYI